MEKKEVVTANTLCLERQHGPRRNWKKMTVPTCKKKAELKLGPDLPYDGKILVWFTPEAAILQPSFKITVRGHTRKPYDEVIILSMSGRHEICICGVKYCAMVN